jgi:hypothetical protein
MRPQAHDGRSVWNPAVYGWKTRRGFRVNLDRIDGIFKGNGTNDCSDTLREIA